MTDLIKNTGMRCFCGAELWLDVDNELYICSECKQPEDDCECEYTHS